MDELLELEELLETDDAEELDPEHVTVSGFGVVYDQYHVPAFATIVRRSLTVVPQALFEITIGIGNVSVAPVAATPLQIPTVRLQSNPAIIIDDHVLSFGRAGS